MRVLDLFSGIGAGSLGFKMAGHEVVGHSEIEPFPSAVLKHHFPEIPNYGDVTGFKKWPDDIEPDILIGGSPCQSFSVAGLRKGLADPRGNLMLTYLAVVDRYRPRWVVWENVPGALSADGGRAFAAMLRGLAQCGYHAAWRVLDAQHVRSPGFCRAVPQRRRRVFVVGYHGDWRRAAAVLFDSESSERRPSQGRRKKEAVAALTANGVGTCGADDNQAQAGHLIPGVANALTASAAGRGFSALGAAGQTCIVQPREVANTLTARMHKGINTTLDEGQTPIVVNARQDPISGYIPGSLDVDGGTWAVARGFSVRKLTPMECERLQGFPDGWTDIMFNGRKASDTARYKALGNAMAVNVVRWIAERINMVEETVDGIRNEAC